MAIFLLCVTFVIFIQFITSDTLRSIPSIGLVCLGFGSVVVLMIEGNKKYSTSKKGENSRVSRVIVMMVKIVLVIGLVIVALIGLFILPFAYEPEHIVIRNDIKMIARVERFWDRQVYYCQYKNPFFYGKNLGYEYYGSGSGDPLAETPTPSPHHWAFYDLGGNLIEKCDAEGNVYKANIAEKQSQNDLKQQAEMKELKVAVMNNREDERVFSITIDDFIDSYNGFYWKDKRNRYLLPASEWRSRIYDTAIHSNHETICYNFTEDEKIKSLPTISVYTPTNGNYIQEITLNFDDHSYTKATYNLYEKICFYTLKVFFPDLENEKIIDLYQTLNRLAYENIMPHEQGYSSTSIPCALYYKDGVGLYPYFAFGESVRLCIIPVTEETISDFENKGVTINEIE